MERNIQELMEQASVWVDQGQFEMARMLYSQICEWDSGNAEAWLMLGAIHGELGVVNDAIRCIKQAVTLAPDYGQAFFTLGHVYWAQGMMEEAQASYRRATEVESENAEAWYRLGQCQEAEGDAIGAEISYRRALQLQPNYAEVWFALGNHKQLAGNMDTALSCYQKASQLIPTWADVYNNMGTALQAKGQIGAAIECYQRALQYKPEFAEACSNLGDMLQRQGQSDLAPEYYERALRLDPDNDRVLYGLARAWQELGYPDRAVECYQGSLAISNNDATRVRMATVLPVVLDSIEQIASFRKQLGENLDALMRESVLVSDPSRDIDATLFYLVHHGQDDLPLQRKMSALYEHCAPSLTYVSPHCFKSSHRRRNGRIAIGFVSRFFNNHTIGTVMKGLIEQLSREMFEVTVFSVESDHDNTSRFIQDRADRFIEIPIDLVKARELVTQQQLDILFYTDIGMDPFTYYLAFSRLAPIQCTTWGHPVTTGIPNIDYYISCKDFEPDGAQDHYSEKLICLDSPPTYYQRPKSPDTVDRQSLGLAANAHFYLCPQTLFKFHPDFDEFIAGILRADPEGEVILLSCKYKQWAELLLQRLQRTIPDVMDRIRLLPYPGTEGYLKLIASADVMLDTVHYGGGHTSLQALAVGTPIVTLPGAFQRGRHTYAYYRKMGFMDCVADDREGYIRIAVGLGSDKMKREETRSKILSANHVLFENQELVRQLETVLVGCLEADH